MSDMNDALTAWRQALLSSGGVSADEVAELESHLLDAIDGLRKAGLNSEEAFVIASRRLGQPCELAAEFSKNQALMSWRRPARLVLWGMLVLELMSVIWTVFLAVTYHYNIGKFNNFQWLQISYWLYHVAEACALVLFWLLAEFPQGRVARTLAALEEWVQTLYGAIGLVVGVVLFVLANSALRFSRIWLRPDGSGLNQQLLPYSFMTQVVLNQLLWTVPITIMLIVLIRSERAAPFRGLVAR